MIQFKISIFIASLSCTKTPYPKIGGFGEEAMYDRYDVYINNTLIGVTGDNNFQVNVDLNSIVELKIIDKTGILADYTNSFQLYDRSVWFDISLLYNKTNQGISDYNCHLGINGEGIDTQGDYLQGSNYFRWEFVGYDSLNVPVSQTIRVRRPREGSDYTPPILGQLIPFSNVWDVEPVFVNADIDTVSSVPTLGWYAIVNNRIEGYESYYTAVGNQWRLDFDSLTQIYLIYLHQAGYVSSSGGCCGGNHIAVVFDCEYNFEIPQSIERDLYYCSSEVAFIDIPCSRNKMLYRTSSTMGELKVEYYCDGAWKFIGNLNKSLLLPIETLCNKDEVIIKVTCNIEGSTGCCGNTNVNIEPSTCSKELTIKTLPYCITGDIIGQQEHCGNIIGCDDCGDIPDRYIIDNPIQFRVNREWNNLVIYYYHNEEFIELKNTFKSTNDIVPNIVQWLIYKFDTITKLYTLVYEGNQIEEPNDTTLTYTFDDSGVYKIVARLTNTCGTKGIEQQIYVYAQNVITRENCSLYKLLHCIDRDLPLTIRRYKDGSIVYEWNPITQIETKTSDVRVVYDEDFYLYQITFNVDNIYKVEYNDNQFIVVHDCFITNCHQEYIKSLVCEEDICKVLLDQCKVTDDTLLKTYYIQKYVLLYDVYKSLLSKIVNIEYIQVIEPNVLFEENYCVDLYNIWNIIDTLKQMCISCGYNTINTVENDCGCK